MESQAPKRVKALVNRLLISSAEEAREGFSCSAVSVIALHSVSMFLACRIMYNFDKCGLDVDLTFKHL